MGKFGNFMGNTFGIVPRGAGTVGLAWIDTLRLGGNVLSDLGTIVEDTSTKLRDTLSSSRTKGKWYNKLYQVPIGLVAWTWALIEWAVRLALEPSRNAVLNARDIVGNFGINAWSSIKSLFDTHSPASSFTFEKLQTKTPTKENWFSKLARWNKSSTPAPVPVPAPTPTP